MIVTRGMGGQCGLASFGLGSWSVVVILPDRIFVSALGQAPYILPDVGVPVAMAVLLSPALGIMLAIPLALANTLIEVIMDADVIYPVVDASTVFPSITASVVSPDAWGDGE